MFQYISALLRPQYIYGPSPCSYRFRWVFFRFLMMENNHVEGLYFICWFFFIFFSKLMPEKFETFRMFTNLHQIFLLITVETGTTAGLSADRRSISALFWQHLAAKVCVFPFITVKPWPSSAHTHPLPSEAAGEFIMLTRTCPCPSPRSVSCLPSRMRADRLALRWLPPAPLCTDSGAWSAA